MIARFICLNKVDRDWVLKHLSNNEAALLKEFCSEAETLGLSRNKNLLLNAISESQEYTPTPESEDHISPDILALDDFWINLYLSSAPETDTDKVANGRKLLPYDKPIRASKLLVTHLNNYMGQQKCRG